MARKRRRLEAEGLPPRQRAILEDVRRFGYVSTSLIGEFHYGSGGASALKMARRELRHLTNNGFLVSLPMRKDRGAPENVFCLAGAKTPRSLLFLPHLLATNRLAMTVRAACALHGDYSFDFMVEHEAIARPQAKGTRRPDLVFTVLSPKGRGVYLAEVDRSTEPIRTGKKRANIQEKLEWYAGLADGELDHYREVFSYDFRGFRAVYVTSRPDSIVNACIQVRTGDVIGVADHKDITVRTVIDAPIWAVPGLGADKKLKLNWHPDDIEGALDAP